MGALLAISARDSAAITWLVEHPAVTRSPEGPEKASQADRLAVPALIAITKHRVRRNVAQDASLGGNLSPGRSQFAAAQA